MGKKGWETLQCISSNNGSFSGLYLHSRGGHRSGVPESTPEGFCVFLSDPDPKICEKPDPESFFNFGGCRSLRDHFWSKNMGKFLLAQWWSDSEHESDSQIWKISGSGFKHFETGAESVAVTPATSAALTHRCKFHKRSALSARNQQSDYLTALQRWAEQWRSQPRNFGGNVWF